MKSIFLPFYFFLLFFAVFLLFFDVLRGKKMKKNIGLQI